MNQGMDICLTCLKGEEWCFAVGEVGHISPDQPPPWQEVELPVPRRKKGRSGHRWKKGKEPVQAPAPMRGILDWLMDPKHVMLVNRHGKPIDAIPYT
ncbi:hypothetical protein EOD39_14232 [Acipenser ruthenus]|uniref:Uncharacterized protein n=1 Tax=Acipenser ruthenus TaxID=7906 RepID=A0A662YM51_ACIRT|nr:hypothetical protein EOD39_14232 [Acipenser ruthenus]